MQTSARQAYGYALAAAGACLWSTLGVLGKTAYAQGADPLSVIALRAMIATVILGAVMLCRPSLFRLELTDLPFFAIYGIVGVALNYLGYFYALRYSTVATAITTLYTYPAMVLVLAVAIYREPLARLKVVALSLSFLGIVLVAFGSPSIGPLDDLNGVAFGLLAAASNAVYVLAGKHALTKYNTMTAVFFSFLFGSLALNTFRYLELGFTLNMNMNAIQTVLVIAVLPTLLGYSIFTYSLRFIEVSRASIISSIDPAMAIYLAYLFLQEAPNAIQLAGSVSVIVSAAILSAGHRELQ